MSFTNRQLTKLGSNQINGRKTIQTRLKNYVNNFSGTQNWPMRNIISNRHSSIRCLCLPPATLKQFFRHGTCEYKPPFFCASATRNPYCWRKICPESFCQTSLSARRERKDGCMALLTPDTWHLQHQYKYYTYDTKYQPLKPWCQCCQCRVMYTCTCVTHLRLRKRTGQLPIPLCLFSNEYGLISPRSHNSLQS